ncbi:hypothetical protein K474DRAFT_232297 [Panus rudis PR-1116 ss-1]|nr:hypothetical protein K474DRAFT_232297 [Panus rudis PR-1116 ss-1]
MSVARSNAQNHRRNNRNALSSPYRRPAPQKSSSSWSWRGLLSSLNPLRLVSNESEEDEVEDEEEEEDVSPRARAQPLQAASAAASLRERGQQIVNHAGNGHVPESASGSMDVSPNKDKAPQASTSKGPSSSPSASSLSRSISVEDEPPIDDPINYVSKYLARKGGQKLNKTSNIYQSTFEEGLDRVKEFHFKTPPSSTPNRGLSPAGSIPQFPSPNDAHQLPTPPSSQETPASAQKVLTYNPNGSYKWLGAGTARTRRTRYSSPGFGQSRTQRPSFKIPLPPPKPATTDNKRRRVGETAQASTAQPSPAQAASSPRSSPAAAKSASPPQPSSPVNGVTTANKPNGINPPTTPRGRTPGRTTAPAVSSPLRQAWGQADSPPSPPASKPTRAAALVTDIIKELTPPKVPEVLNPYEDPSLVHAKRPKKPIVKRPRPAPAPKPVEPEPEPKKDISTLSPQKIIEATVPKGSKRSRPPPDLQKTRSEAARQAESSSDGVRRSARLKSPSPPQVPSSVPSQATQSLRDGARKPPAVIVEEVEDEDEPSPKKQKTTAPAPTIEEVDDVDMPSSATTTKPAQVVEPVESERKPNGDSQRRSPSPSAPSANLFAPPGPLNRAIYNVKSSAPKAPSKLRFSIKAEEDTVEQVIPKTNGTSAEPTLPPPPRPAFAVPAVPPSKQTAPPTSAPSISFGSSANQATKLAPKTREEVRAAVLALPVTDLPTFTFDVPTSSPGAGPGPNSQKARQAALAVSRTSLPQFDLSCTPSIPASKSVPTINGTTAAAGNSSSTNGKSLFAPPPSGSWVCTLCMVQNPASITDKCPCCETPRPASSSAAPPAKSGGFNWDAAKAGSTLSSASDAKDAPKADKSSSSSSGSGFNWSAAGMKPPPSTGTWTCSTCMIQNPSDKSKCMACETDRS